MAADLFPKVQISPNVGLAKSNNLGASLGVAPYLLFANPDLTPRLETFAPLKSHLDEAGGLVAPRLTDYLGTPQENARGWPSLAVQICNRVSIPSRRKHEYRWPIRLGESGPVPWITGAAVATTRKDHNQLGGWPEQYFLYFEDVAYCARAHAAGLPVWLLGDSTWTHTWNRASRSILSRSSRLHAKAALQFYREHPSMIFRPKHRTP